MYKNCQVMFSIAQTLAKTTLSKDQGDTSN